jgi:NAD(P)-dependent dehydrogenase (short-subunit alcohol dehydrogenase family)
MLKTYPALYVATRQGRAIVNMSSVVGVVGNPTISMYSATKHAVWGLTQSTALEFAKKGIRINAVGPGSVDTPMIQDFIDMNNGDPAVMDAIKAGHPIGRQGTPEEVANAVVWLCSDEASFITGHILMIDGGITAG